MNDHPDCIFLEKFYHSESELLRKKELEGSSILRRFGLSDREIEAYRVLRTRLSALGPLKTLLFSSSLSGEGTSTVLSDFAVTLGRDGFSTVLIDGNLRRPSLHRRFNLMKLNGLTELIFGDIDLDEGLKKTEVPDLYVVTAGRSLSDPVFVLRSERLEKLIQDLKEDFDYVLIDSPPVNLYSDSIQLANIVDGVILVVRAEGTRLEVVQRVKEHLEELNAPLLGVVLNGRRYVIPDFLYKRLK